MNHMARPEKLGLCNHSLYADNARSVQDFKVNHSVIVTPPRLRERERAAWSSLFVCAGSFDLLLNCLRQFEVRR